MLAQSRLLAMRKLSFSESGWLNQSCGTAAAEARKSLAGKAGEQTTLCKAAHCSAMVVLFQGGVQGRRQQRRRWRWLEEVEVPVLGGETWAAAWECAGGSCHWLAPQKEQRRLEKTGRVDQLGWNWNLAAYS